MDDVKLEPAAQSVVEPTTQVVPPATEVPSTTVQTSQEVATSGGEPELPGATEEQRRAFQELRLENKRLKEETEARMSNESAFSAFRPKTVLPSDMASYTDPTTGEVNWVAYNQAGMERARAEASQVARDEVDEFQARQKHPELFADRNVEQEIADMWFAAKMRGENVTVSTVADRYAKRFGKVVTKAEQSGAAKALEQLTSKEQAALAASTQNAGQSGTSGGNLGDLQQATRKGDVEAISARLKGVGWGP